MRGSTDHGGAAQTLWLMVAALAAVGLVGTMADSGSRPLVSAPLVLATILCASLMMLARAARRSGNANRG